MKDRLCHAFCDALRISEVPMGYVVSTGFRRPSGDIIGFYISKPNDRGLYRIEDDGLTIPDLEAAGFDLNNPERQSELNRMLAECNAQFDDEKMTLVMNGLKEEEIPIRAMEFIQLLIRTQDLYMITKEKIANTFEQDAIEEISRALSGRAEIRTKTFVHEKLKEFVADVVIRSNDRAPVAVYMTKTDQRLLEAILLQNISQYEAKIPCNVIALLEKPTSVSKANWNRATNRLAAITIFSEGETSAAERIAREALGGMALIN